MSSIDSLPQSSTPATDPAMNAVLELEAAARLLDLEDWIVDRLRHPESETRFNVHIVRDSGEPFTCPVLHVVHNTTLGRSCGRIDFAPDAFMGDLSSHAIQSTWQHALLGLAFGGAATAVVCDPRNLSERELRRLAAEVRTLRFNDGSIFMPGVGPNSSVMGWLATPPRGHEIVFTGRPLALDGVDPDYMQALVVTELIRSSLDRRHESLKGKRVAVQGFDELGQHVAMMCYQAGAHVVGVADVSGGLFDPQGMHPDSLLGHLKREGILLGYPNAEAASNEEIHDCICDVLVLTAGQDHITIANADGINASLIIEASQGAVRAEAETALASRECLVVPESVAGSGVSLAASLEVRQPLTATWTKSRERAFARRAVREAERTIQSAAVKWELRLREAAVTIAVEKVAAAIRAYGK